MFEKDIAVLLFVEREALEEDEELLVSEREMLEEELLVAEPEALEEDMRNIARQLSVRIREKILARGPEIFAREEASSPVV